LGNAVRTDSRSELRRRRIQLISYVLLGAPASATVGVVLLALRH
jgi:hypothetical protein